MKYLDYSYFQTNLADKEKHKTKLEKKLTARWAQWLSDWLLALCAVVSIPARNKYLFGL